MCKHWQVHSQHCKVSGGKKNKKKHISRTYCPYKLLLCLPPKPKQIEKKFTITSLR